MFDDARWVTIRATVTTVRVTSAAAAAWFRLATVSVDEREDDFSQHCSSWVGSFLNQHPHTNVSAANQAPAPSLLLHSLEL